uniref:Uncharacterized protein n=1 Tax=Geoglobus ahangari TaxID=113653 RepID=A0A7C4W557_9EURY
MKGQLMILTGFLIAVGLVILIMLIDSMIYSLSSPVTVDISERRAIESLEYWINKSVHDALINASKTIDAQGISNTTVAMVILENEAKTFKRFFRALEEYYGIEGRLVNITADIECAAYNESGNLSLWINATVNLSYKDEDLELRKVLNIFAGRRV